MNSRAWSLCFSVGAGSWPDSSRRASYRRPHQRRRADGPRELDITDAVRVCRYVISRIDRLLRDLGFLGCNGLRKCPFNDAADLQDHERMGKP